jgi:hypothetical protein
VKKRKWRADKEGHSGREESHQVLPFLSGNEKPTNKQPPSKHPIHTISIPFPSLLFVFWLSPKMNLMRGKFNGIIT